jgi:hypothetical protein
MSASSIGACSLSPDATPGDLVFPVGKRPGPRHRLTTETVEKHGKVYPVAEFVEPDAD